MNLPNALIYQFIWWAIAEQCRSARSVGLNIIMPSSKLWHFNIENAIAVIRDEKTITNKHGKELGAIVHLHVTNTRETCRRFY